MEVCPRMKCLTEMVVDYRHLIDVGHRLTCMVTDYLHLTGGVDQYMTKEDLPTVIEKITEALDLLIGMKDGTLAEKIEGVHRLGKTETTGEVLMVIGEIPEDPRIIDETRHQKEGEVIEIEVITKMMNKGVTIGDGLEIGEMMMREKCAIDHHHKTGIRVTENTGSQENKISTESGVHQKEDPEVRRS